MIHAFCQPAKCVTYVSGTKRYLCLGPLSIQSGGRPIRIFYASDPRRTAILLIGVRKIEQERFYREYVRRADAIYGEYVRQLRREGSLESERGWE